MAFAEVVKGRTWGNPGYFIISEMQIAVKKDIFLYVKALSFSFTQLWKK